MYSPKFLELGAFLVLDWGGVDSGVRFSPMLLRKNRRNPTKMERIRYKPSNRKSKNLITN